MLNLTRLFLVLVLMGSMYFTSYAQNKLVQLQKLSTEADVIVTGKVDQQISSWNETKTRIFTKTTLQVDEYLKGGINKMVIEINTPGGEVGEIGELYTHMPKFKKNEEVLLFLKKEKKNSFYKVLNGEDGKIEVLNNPTTQKKITSSNMPLNSLKEQIKSFVNEN